MYSRLLFNCRPGKFMSPSLISCRDWLPKMWMVTLASAIIIDTTGIIGFLSCLFINLSSFPQLITSIWMQLFMCAGVAYSYIAFEVCRGNLLWYNRFIFGSALLAWRSGSRVLSACAWHVVCVFWATEKNCDVLNFFVSRLDLNKISADWNKMAAWIRENAHFIFFLHQKFCIKVASRFPSCILEV